MRAGALIHRATFERRPNTKGIAGGRVDEWQEVCSRRVAIQFQGGRESAAGRAEIAQATHLIRVRGDSITRGITPRDRIVVGDDAYNIEHIDNIDGRGIDLLMYCRLAV